MKRRRSLDDICDIFLSRRLITNQRAAGEFADHAPPSCAENIEIPPYFLLPRLLQIPELSASAKPLPFPGSSGAVQAKQARLANGHRHIPRPRNPFILFRCDLVHRRKMLPRSDLDDTNISRVAGELWHEMTAAQKKPWIELAAQEKARHALLYPDYKYSPVYSGSKTKKTKDSNAFLEDRSRYQVSRTGAASPSVHPKPRRQPERTRPYPQRLPRRRSSSCPPVGAIPVPSHPPLEGWAPTFTQDDMQRRQSRVIMYQSVTPQSFSEPIAPMPAGYNHMLPLQGLDWLSFPQVDPLLLDPTYALPDMNQNPESYTGSNCGFFDYEPTFPHTCKSLKHTERLAIETTLTDQFSTLATIPMDSSPWAFSAAISPFECSGHSTPSTPSSGNLSYN